jgi:hypothetical protein
MFWLGLVFLWFAWTVLVRSARERFACGALVAAFLIVGLLHLLNPDAYIVRANAAHARAGRAFDAEYAVSLSADAVPALISAMPSLSREERCFVARSLSGNWSRPAPEENDWRSWNIARSRAWRTIAAHQEDLSEATCPPPVSSVPVMTTTSAPETTTTPSSGAMIPITPASTTNSNTNATASVATTNATTNTTTDAATSTATTGTSTSAATMSMVTETKSAKANSAKRAKAATRGVNRKARQPNRARAANRARAR